MSDPGAVNKTRSKRLEQMLVAKRAELVATLERQLGMRAEEDLLRSLDETIEIGDRSVLVHAQDVDFGVLQMRRDELRQIDEALKRLRAGEYGRCEDCEVEIEEERLATLPFATLCVDCKRRQEIDEKRVETTGRGFRAGFRDVREGSLDEDED